MSQVYLTGIELVQFRSFASLKVELAARPSVLIVHGSNGLGKSSLFDALEWTLTDNIDHFRPANGYDKVGKYLCRWRDEPGSTSVAMSFSDGKVIERQLASPQAVISTLAGVDDVSQYLRTDAWKPQISALNRYLLLTHFLGQSTLSRLTHRSSDERFEILKEAAQSAELEAIGIAMHGKGSNAAARAFTKRIGDLERDINDLRNLLSQETELWKGAHASGAIDDGAARDLVQQIASALSRVSPVIGSNVPGSISIDRFSDDALQTSIATSAGAVRNRRLAIAQSRLVLEEKGRNSLEVVQKRAASLEAERELATAAAAATQATTDAAAKRREAATKLQALATTRNAHMQLVQLREATARLAQLRDEHRRFAISLTDAERSLKGTENEVERVERRRQIIARLESEISSTDNQIASLREEVDRCAQWIARSSSLDVQRRTLASMELRNPSIDQAVDAAADALEEAHRVADVQGSLLSEMQKSVSALTAAVSTIATHLPVDACDCPVCATRFDNADLLHERVALAAARLAPLLVEQEEASRRAQTELNAATDRLRTSRELQSEIRLTRQRLTSEQSHNDQLLERIAWVGPADLSSLEGYRLELVSKIQALQARRDRRGRWISSLAPDDISSLLGDAIRRRDDALRQRETLARRLSDLAAAEQASATEVLTRTTVIFPSEPTQLRADWLESAIDTVAHELQRAQEASDAARDVSTEFDARAASSQQAVASAAARVEELEKQLAQAVSEAQRIQSQWHQLGWLENGPTVLDLEGVDQDLAASESAVEEATLIHRRLREGREAWARQQAHRGTFERLRLAVDLAPNSERDQIRDVGEKNLAEKQRQLEATKQAKEIASLASTDIAREVEEFNAEYIQPLDALMKQINRAILCDPRVGIDLHVRRKKIEQSASSNGEVPAAIGQIDPLLVHSEGQMAALAVSMLCAASLTYPWARWRALILDDPLQHNDAIHAAAFADFIANLVQQKDYQVLLSTHDLGQAEFLQRKFDARRIPCATLSLLGRGKEGVEWVFKHSRLGHGVLASAPPPAANA
ncbi:AAA family ATPase [Mesorhizobium newzealandense]|uniref:AAA family ATPase n=1 Tax=Mesorhizobium newzealandense TaxID=1300302 RepID=A0ABW4UD41_9HYPH